MPEHPLSAAIEQLQAEVNYAAEKDYAAGEDATLLYIYIQKAVTKAVSRLREFTRTPIPMRLPCPGMVPDEYGGMKVCGQLHIDKGEFVTKLHHTHSCQFCGMTWRPAVPYTVGVAFLPGFKDP